MKVGCRLIISTFRTELSPNPPCIAALKTEMFGTFIFKHAQALYSCKYFVLEVLVCIDEKKKNDTEASSLFSLD
jgi:hypothetical protein